MTLGGKSSDKSSREMINMQKAEAADARYKEQLRQDRLNAGLARIKAAFHGQPVTKSVAQNYTLAAPPAGATSGTAVSGLPAGYTYVQVPTGEATAPAATPTSYVGGKGVTQPTTKAGTVTYGGQSGHGGGYTVQGGGGSTYPGSPYSSSSNSGGGYQQTPPASPATAAPTKWMVRDPSGNMYEVGQSFDYTTQQDTGQTTGGPEDFYKKYQTNYLDYYLPQVAQKFGEAKDETTYALARAGTLRSTAATDELAKLIDQNKMNEADVRTKATNAVGDLKSRMAQEEAKAQAQLYSTEDPNVAATSATNAVQNITAEEPSSTPLGDIFKVAAIGGANFLKGGTNRFYRDKYVPGNQPSTHIV